MVRLFEARLKWESCARILLAAIVSTLLFPSADYAAETARINGLVFTLSDNVQTVWPNARVTLKDLGAGKEMSAVTDDLGEYAFVDVLKGDYELSVTLAGFAMQTKKVKIEGGKHQRIDFQLVPKSQAQSVIVGAEVPGVDTTATSSSSTLTANTLKSVIRLSDDFQQALPLLPGVLRGPDGQIRIKGGRTNQTSALVNTASVADPFTGQPALRLPAVAVASVRVLSNPFSAEYGQFASGVVEVNTRGGTDEWKFLFEDPIPRFRWIHNEIHGVESASPHLTFAGPIKRGKLYVFQSLYFGYDTIRVPSLPDPDNVRVQKLVNTHTQVDWDLTPNQRFTAILTVDPQRTNFATIDTFNPQPVTADYKQRGFFTSLTHRWIFKNGGFLQTLFSAKRLDPQIFPATAESGEMTLFPEQNSGTYFNRQDRRTRLFQWSENLHLRPMKFGGLHLLTVGYSYERSTYDGRWASLPVRVLREDGTLSQRIEFALPQNSAATKDGFAFFLQDSWQVGSRLVLDLGLRADHDSFAAEPVNFSPRVGFVYAPTRDNRTAIRGGFGVFYDKIPINVAVFREFPAETVTRFAADGSTISSGPSTFFHAIETTDGRLRVPRSYGWTLQIDRELRRGLLLRFGYEQREAYREFYLDPLSQPGSAQLRLFNNGQQSYREFLGLLRWQVNERTTLYASYVRSRASGELNDYNQFFGNFPSPLVRANQRGPLSSDAPNRLLFWGILGLPYKFEFVPILDVHTGFPFSRIDENWDFLGARNQAGRFPVFVGMDTTIRYPFDFKFRGHHFQFRAGFKMTNVLNHFNPRDVQQSVASPHFGTFYNSVPRQYRIEGDFDF